MMEKEFVGFRIDKPLAGLLVAESAHQGYSISQYARAIIKEALGLPENRRPKMMEEHMANLEVCRRLAVTIKAERALIQSYDEFDNVELLNRVASWKFQEPKKQSKDGGS